MAGEEGRGACEGSLGGSGGKWMRSSAGGHRGADDWEVLGRGAGEGKFWAGELGRVNLTSSIIYLNEQSHVLCVHVLAVDNSIDYVLYCIVQ